uniref:Uncharacterized protein n=1 Tax=Arion vulgaris TaxID=1028688 RepID=A0A0B7B3W7_9EUPU
MRRQMDKMRIQNKRDMKLIFQLPVCVISVSPALLSLFLGKSSLTEFSIAVSLDNVL